MQNIKTFVVSVTGFCFLIIIVGSEEFISELKDRSHQNGKEGPSPSDFHSDLSPYRHLVRAPQSNFPNPKYFGPPPPPHHHHEFYLPPEHPHQLHEHHQPGLSGPGTLPLSPETHDQNTEKTNVEKDIDNEIPLEIAKKMDTIDIKDFLSNYVDGYEEEEKPSFESRFGDEGQERNAPIIPAKAKCSIENTTVEVATSDDPTIFYVPKCTKIERCSGCCSHKKLSCQAVVTETISVEVYKLQWKVMNQKFKYASKEVVPLERHIQCSCSCRIRPEDCLPYQQYVKENCECACTNTDEELKCIKDSTKKYWDPASCSCKCLTIPECFDGYTYDHNECKCKAPQKRRNVRYERHEYSTEDLRVQAINEEN